MRVLGLTGVLCALGMAGAAMGDDSMQAARAEYKMVRRHAMQVAHMMEHVYKPGMAEDFLEEYDKGMSEEAVSVYERIMEAYEDMRKKLLEFGDAAANAECSFEERKRLAIEVVDKSMEVVSLKTRLNMECGFSEQTLKNLNEMGRSCHSSFMWSLRNPRMDASGFLFNVYND